MISRASRPLSLTVPPEIFRLVTKARMSFSEALVLRGISGRSRNSQQCVLVAKQPSEQPVKYYVTGSAAIEDSVEAGTQGGLLRCPRFA